MAARDTAKRVGRVPGLKTEIIVGVIATVVLLGAIGLIVWQLNNDANPDATTVGAFLLAVVATTAIAFPLGFISLGRQISNVNAFGITLELQVQEAKVAVDQFENEEDDAGVDPPAWPSSNRRAMAMISDRLREKLRFVSVALFDARKGVPEELIVENLGNECLLPLNEVTLCRDLLGDLFKRLDELDSDEREDFLNSSWEFAARFASRIFDRQARRELTEHGWKIGSFSQKKGHRPDFIAVREGVAALIAARVAAPDPEKNLRKTGGRLARVDFPLPEMRRVVVVPSYVDHLWDELDNGPMGIDSSVLVVRLGKLIGNWEFANRDPGQMPQIPPPDDDEK